MAVNKNNKLITFYSPQGGTGKSTLAMNMAIFCSSRGSRVLLVDMSIYGGIASMLRIPVKGGMGLTAVLTLLDLNSDDIDDAKLNEIIRNSIVNSGVNKNMDALLSANPIKMEAINEKYCSALISGLKRLDYDLILADTSSELSEKNMLLIEHSDLCVLPVIQDISCGWKMVMFREVMDKCRIDKNKFGIIANMCSKYSGFNNLELEKEVGYRLLYEIPFFRKKYQNYLNEGLLISNMKNKKAKRHFFEATKRIITMLKNSSAERQL